MAAVRFSDNGSFIKHILPLKNACPKYRAGEFQKKERKMYPYFNQYQAPFQQVQPPQPQQAPQAVIRVHGEEGAKAYSLPPNSSVLLLDETQNAVWLKMTDGAGYPTVTGYEIRPLEDKNQKEFTSLEERIKRIEDDIYGNQSNTSSTK